MPKKELNLGISEIQLSENCFRTELFAETRILSETLVSSIVNKEH